jgi:hypothetical protein
MATEYTITYPTTHPDFSVPGFGKIDFGSASDGAYSDGYKMIAFEPGKILQAQELNEIQFRMNAHQTLTMKMVSNWMSTIVLAGTQDSSGPGWDGATPIDPTMITLSSDAISIGIKNWYLCKARSSGLFFWLYTQTDSRTTNSVATLLSDIPLNSYIGFVLNTSANGTYTGEIVDCNTTGTNGNHQLQVKNTSVCGSSRYYLKIVDIEIRQNNNTNDFAAIAQKRSDGMYFLNNIKVESAV